MIFEISLTVGALFYLVLWVTTLGVFRPLTMERSGVYILTAGMMAGIAFGADRLVDNAWGLSTVARSLGESAFLALVLFLRWVRLGLSRRQEVLGSWLVLVGTALHLYLNLTLHGAWLFGVMAIQIVALFSWVLYEAVHLHRVQPSGITKMLVVMIVLQIFLETTGRGSVGLLLWLDPMGRGADWAASLVNWLWITFSVGFAVLATTAAVLMDGFRSDKFRLEQVVQQVEARLREKEALLMSLMMSDADRKNESGMASLAHELRQPLMAIQLNAEYLASGKRVSPQEETQVLGAILRENQRAGEIIQGIRSLFVNKAPQQLAVLSLSSWLTDWVHSRAQTLLEHNGVLLQLHAQSGVMVQVHAAQLEVILQNLVHNAVEAMSGMPRGRIDVSLVVHEQMAQIDVLDSGPGVPLAIRKSIFEMNYSTKPQGMGLGLWLSRRIAQRHGGRLQLIASVHGALMRLHLPLLETAFQNKNQFVAS